MRIVLLLSMIVCFIYAENSISVKYGGEADLDACGEVGMIKGINKQGDGFVSVRSGPSTKYKIRNKIYKNGTQVFICDGRGKWVGVVYGRDDCGVSSPIRRRQAYKGNCKTGWIYEKYVGNDYIVQNSNQEVKQSVSQVKYYSIEELFLLVNHQNTDLQNKTLTEKMKNSGIIVRDSCLVKEVDRDDGLFGDKNMFTIDCATNNVRQTVRLKTNNTNVINLHRGDRVPFEGTIKSLDAMNDYMKMQSLVVNL